MPDINDFNNYSGDVVSGVETVKKKKTGLIVGITAGVTAGAVAVVAGGGIAAYALSDFVKNQVKLRVSSPESYYAWVNEKNADETAHEIAEAYRISLDNYAAGQKSQISLKYDISQEAKDYFIEETNLDPEDDSEFGDKMLCDVINATDSIKVGMNSDSKADLISGSAFIDRNDDRLLTVDIASDISTMDYFVRLPELTEKWLAVEAGSLIENEVYDSDEKAVIEAYKKAMRDPASVMTPEELEQEVSRYIKVWDESVGEVDLEKGQKLTVGDISVTYTVASVEIDEKKANDIQTNFLNAVKDDELLKDIVVNRLSAATEEEYKEMLDDAFDDLKTAEDEFSEEKIVVSTYIDPKGVIRGLSVKGSDENEEFKAIIGKDGDNVRGEMYLLDGDTEPEFKIDLTADGVNDVYTGNIVFSDDDDDTISVEFKDFEVVDKERGFFNASTSLIINVDDEEISPIGIDFTSDGSSQSIAGDLNIEGTNYGRLTFTYGIENGAEPVIPSKDGAYLISEDFDEDEILEDYVTKDEVEDFILQTLKKLGFKETDAALLTKGAVSSIYGESSYKIDYDDDDYDWDDDDFDKKRLDDDKDADKDSDDGDFDDDDFDYSDYLPKEGSAYLVYADKDFNVYNLSFSKDNPSIIDLEKDGTYTLKATFTPPTTAAAKKPNGLSMLGFAASGKGDLEGAELTLKSVKFDGKEVEITDNKPLTETYGSYLSSTFYIGGYFVDDDDETYKPCIKADDLGEWEEIEVTIEIKGIK